MAACVESGDLYVHAEFVSLLKVANICVGLAEQKGSTSNAPSMATISQVVFSADEIKIGLSSTQDAVVVLKWPQSIRLLPDTCSRLTCMSDALTFRCQYDQRAGSEPTNHVSLPSIKRRLERRTFERIVCRVCSNNFKAANCGPVATRVPISALGLPPGLSWEDMDMSMSYFCHDHNHAGRDELHAGDDVEESTEGQLMTTSFGPQVSEYFDGDTHVVFNSAVLSYDRISVSKSTGIVDCSRCHKHVGRVVNSADVMADIDGRPQLIKLYSDAIGGNGTGCDELSIFAKILKSGDVKCRRLCLVDDEDHSGLSDAKITALLAIVMDRDLKTMKASFDEGLGTLNTVSKLLYRVDDDADQSPVVRQWLADPAVRLVRVHRELLDKFGVALTRSTRQLPLAWRYADEFCVCYIPHVD